MAAFIDSSSSIIMATLTRRGRELMATDSSQFLITKFAFGDDEIYYNDYDGTSPDSDNSTVLATPVLEPASENVSPLRWGIVSLPQNTVIVANIITEPTLLSVGVGASLTFKVRTLRGNDSGYNVSTNNVDIIPSQQFYSSVRDDNQFDQFQNQTMANITISVANKSGLANKVFVVTIVGQTTGVSRNFGIKIIQKAKDEANLGDEVVTTPTNTGEMKNVSIKGDEAFIDPEVGAVIKKTSVSDSVDTPERPEKSKINQTVTLGSGLIVAVSPKTTGKTPK
jgi:hypothetical protein